MKSNNFKDTSVQLKFVKLDIKTMNYFFDLKGQPHSISLSKNKKYAI